MTTQDPYLVAFLPTEAAREALRLRGALRAIVETLGEAEDERRERDPERGARLTRCEQHIEALALAALRS